MTNPTLQEMQQDCARALGWTLDTHPRNGTEFYSLSYKGEAYYASGFVYHHPEEAWATLPAWGVDWGATMQLVTQVLAVLPTEMSISNDFQMCHQPSRNRTRINIYMQSSRVSSDFYTDPSLWPLHTLQACWRALDAAGLIVPTSTSDPHLPTPRT